MNRPTEQNQPQPALSKVRFIIAVASGKGGVGKSTVTTNLAHALRAQGARVGILDADIYGPSQPGMLGSGGLVGKGGSTDEQGLLIPTENQGVKFMSMGLLVPNDGPVVWRAPMAVKMIHQFLGGVAWGELDYLLLDLPPGTGDVQLTLAQHARLSGVIIVTTPQQVAMGIAKKGLKMFQQVNVPILGVIENMSGFTCSHCGEETAIFKTGGGQALAAEQKLPFLGAVPLDPAVMMSGDSGISILESAKESPAAAAFRALAAQLETQIVSMGLDVSMGEPREVNLTEDGKLRVVWPEGKESVFHPYSLRIRCGCAACIDENSGKRILNPFSVPGDIRILSLSAVGRYALTVTFSDDHSTGIYPYKKLRAYCEEAARDVIPAPAVVSSGSGGGGDREKIEQVLRDLINPGLAGHGGRAELVDFSKGRVSLRLSGGCQGCGAAQMTLKQGIEKTLKAHLPSVHEVLDVTDHDAGTSPYIK